MARMQVPSIVVILLLLTCLPVAAADIVEGDARQFDVGDFLVRLAQTRGLPAPDPDTAERSLRQAGWTLPALDLDASLTEGAVVAIVGMNGFPIRSSNPGAAFSHAQASAIILLLDQPVYAGQDVPPPQQPHASEEADHPDPWDHGADPRTKGKGKKKGLVKSPSSPV